MAANLGQVGLTAQFAPVIKRATATLSDGTAVMIVPDTNLAAATGATDHTGVAKVRIYKATLPARDTWTLATTWTPATVFASATVAAVMSMVLDNNDNMHVVWAGTDNSLNYVVLTYSAGVWTPGTLQVVAASNAVTRRWRAVDIDIASGTVGTTATPAIIAYESKTSAGLSAFVKIWARKSDNTTWTAFTPVDYAAFSGGALTIKAGSEDVSITFNTAGLVSNVVGLCVSYTRMAGTLDYGDVIGEYSYNNSTAVVTGGGSWPIFNHNLGSPNRRIWLFKLSNTVFQAAFSTGAAQPQFSVCRLTSGAHTAPLIDNIVSTGSTGAKTNFSMYTAANAYNFTACEYSDNQVMFGFLYSGIPSYVANAKTAVLGAALFTYASSGTFQASKKDTSVRPLDSYTIWAVNHWPVGLYGGGNSQNSSGARQFNFLTLHGLPGNIATNGMMARAVFDLAIPAPTITAPTTVQATDKPTIKSNIKSVVTYPLSNMKMEWQIASNSTFSSNLHDIVEPDSAYRYIGSLSATAPPIVTIQHALTGVAPEVLFSASWFIRGRAISDSGLPGAWSATQQFSILHQPSALPRSPSPGSVVDIQDGFITVTWDFTDPNLDGDTQTAYQAQLIDGITGSTIVDTGKVTAGDHSATMFVSTSTYADQPLLWRVSLWDKDNTQGPFSNVVAFTGTIGPRTLFTAPVDGGTLSEIQPTITWSTTFDPGQSQKYTRIRFFNADLADLFDRTVASGLGTSTKGDVWTDVVGTLANWHTDSTFGYVALSLSPGEWMTSGAAVADSSQSVTVQFPSFATTTREFVGCLARASASSRGYLGGLAVNNAGQYQAVIYKRTASGWTLVDAGSVFTGTTFTGYRMRFDVIGSSLKLKVWDLSVGEKTYWDCEISDDTWPLAGSCGLAGVALDAGDVGDVWKIDNYMKYSPAGAFADSGFVGTALSQFQYPGPITPLVNATWYVINMQIADTNNVTEETQVFFVTSWTKPAQAVYTVTVDDLKATVSWTNSAIDPDFNSWRIWRRYNAAASVDLDVNNTRNTWVLIYEIRDGDTASFQFLDYLAPLQKNVDYVVTQSVDRNNSMLDSDISTFTTVKLTGTRYYFVPDVPLGSIASFEAKNVTADTFTDDTEQQTILVIDRGNQVQIGTDIGLTGTLTFQMRDINTARADREFLTYVAKNGVGCFMKSPFGDITYIKLSPVAVTRIAGVGPSDFTDLSIPYVEVYNDVPATTR